MSRYFFCFHIHGPCSINMAYNEDPARFRRLFSHSKILVFSQTSHDWYSFNFKSFDDIFVHIF